MKQFRRIETWIFDLDNTLYPAECNLFAQVDQRMGDFIANYLEVSCEAARRLQKDYYRIYGPTLAGLMVRHGLDPKEFLDYVHDIDFSVLPKAPDLGAAIDLLPGRIRTIPVITPLLHVAVHIVKTPRIRRHRFRSKF